MIHYWTMWWWSSSVSVSSSSSSSLMSICRWRSFVVGLLVVITNTFLLQQSESFLLPTSSTSTTIRRQVQILRHEKQQQYCHNCNNRLLFSLESPSSSSLLIVHRRHVGITVLSSSQQQNTIEEKEKSPATRQKRRTWEESFQLLVSYKEQYGNCNVPTKYIDDRRLGRWVKDQRQRKDTLGDEKRTKLDELEFSWTKEMFDDQWEEMFKQLVQYAKENNNGDCNIPKTKNDDEHKKKICLWMKEQRKRKTLLSKERRMKLDKLGLIWEDSDKEKYDKKWNEHYKRLIKYKQKYGHCKVPQQWKEDISLGRWVDKQRTYYRNGMLRKDRQCQLEQVDFTWNIHKKHSVEVVIDSSNRDLKWFKKFGKLVAFQEEYGHCDVPRYYKKHEVLGNWVFTQRVQQKNGTLRNKRKELLTDFGFTWSFEDRREDQWRAKYDQLKTFQETNGHLRLPETSRSLINWVSQQRIIFETQKMDPEKKALLDQIGLKLEKNCDMEP